MKIKKKLDQPSRVRVPYIVDPIGNHWTHVITFQGQARNPVEISIHQYGIHTVDENLEWPFAKKPWSVRMCICIYIYTWMFMEISN